MANFLFFGKLFLISLGIALFNRCGLPIVPTDLFPRELAKITGIRYPIIKISFDILCLAVTAGMTELLSSPVNLAAVIQKYYKKEFYS